MELSPEIQEIAKAIKSMGGKPVIVGGWVRDNLLGKDSKDIDIEVFNVTLDKLIPALQKFGKLSRHGESFDVLQLKTPTWDLDISNPRRETKTGAGHKGFETIADPKMSFEDAASRRDFTINAMGWDMLEGKLLDPFEGKKDLRSKTIRHIGPRFAEDPLRVLRAMQFAGRFDFDIAPETIKIAQTQDLTELAPERLFEEFRKLLMKAENPGEGLKFAKDLGVLEVFPELDAIHDNKEEWARMLKTVNNAAHFKTGDQADDLNLMFASMMASKPKKTANKFLGRMTTEKVVLEGVDKLLENHNKPMEMFESEASLPDFKRLALKVDLSLVERLSRATHVSKPDQPFEKGDWFLRGAVQVKPEHLQPILQGRHLIEIGMKPGPVFGKITNRAFEAQLDGNFEDLGGALKWVPTFLKAEADEMVMQVDMKISLIMNQIAELRGNPNKMVIKAEGAKILKALRQADKVLQQARTMM